MSNANEMISICRLRVRRDMKRINCSAFYIHDQIGGEFIFPFERSRWCAIEQILQDIT